jgi:hypothetical protein
MLFSDMTFAQDWMMNDWWTCPGIAAIIDDGTIAQTPLSLG